MSQMNYTKYSITNRVVIAESGCWEWQGAIGSHGYGTLGANNLAHRMSYELHVGPIPIGHVVCHKCDNRICCNPDHLFVGLHVDNTIDGLNKGRIKRFRSTKVTDEQVQQIRQLIEEGHKQRDIATQFNIRQSHVSRIKTGIRRNTV